MTKSPLVAFAALAAFAFAVPSHAEQSQTTTPSTTTSTAPSSTEKAPAKSDCARKGHAADHKCGHGTGGQGQRTHADQ